MHLLKIPSLLLFGSVTLPAGCRPQTSPPQTIKAATASSGAIKTQETNGAVSGTVAAAATNTQTIQASNTSNINGATASFAPGTLAVDSTVTLEEAAPVASTATLTNLGVAADTGIAVSGSAVDLESSASSDPAGTVALNIPAPIGASLLASSLDNLVIVFRTVHYGEGGKFYDGILTAADFAVAGNLISLKTKYFGVFQGVILTKKLSVAPAPVAAVAPILSVNAQKALPAVSLTNYQVTTNGSSITLMATLSSGSLSACAFELDRDKLAPYDKLSTNNGVPKAEFTSLVTGTYYGRIECVDKSGRNLATEWSAAQMIGAATPSPTPSSASSPPPSAIPASPSSGSGTGNVTPGNGGAIAVANISTGSVSLTWQPASTTGTAPLQYQVFQSTADNIGSTSAAVANGFPVGAPAAGTSLTVTGLSEATFYTFNVVAQDANGIAAAYSRVAVTTPDITPPVPGGSGALSISGSWPSLTVTWGAATDNGSAGSALLYQLYASTADNIGTLALAPMNGTAVGSFVNATWTLAPVSPFTRYYFNVVVKDEAGNMSAYQTANQCSNIVSGQSQCPLSLTGATTTFAGQGTAQGANDGALLQAKFYAPMQMASDGINLYVADSGNNLIRRITPGGQVNTIAGSGSPVDADGNGQTASFKDPRGIVSDGSNLYVADFYGFTIRKLVLSTGDVTTVAGNPGTSAVIDHAIGTAARFNSPGSLALYDHYLYVSDGAANVIRQVDLNPPNAVTTIAGSGATGYTDADGTAASFWTVNSLVVVGATLYITDNHSVRSMTLSPPYTVGTVAGPSTSSFGVANAVGSAARFHAPFGITSDGTYLYVADSASNSIRSINLSTRAVATVAGPSSDGVTGAYLDSGTAGTVRFNQPSGIFSDGLSLYVTDTANQVIRKIQ